MNKFDRTMILPNVGEIVLIYFRQGSGDGWAQCYCVGFWDGNRWRQITVGATNKLSETFLQYVDGWDEIKPKKS